MSVKKIRSPGYPSNALPQCIEIAGKIHTLMRRNPISREAIAKELGYTGITGKSLSLLANLAQYGLIERVKDSQIRVSDSAISILHPRDDVEYWEVLEKAAFNPELFKKIRAEYPDGHVVDSQLKSLLKRMEFSEAALTPAIRSYRATMQFLEEEKTRLNLTSEAVEVPKNESVESASGEALSIGGASVTPTIPLQSPAHTAQSGERLVFSEELNEENYVKLIVKGEMSEILVDALDDYVKRLRRRLGIS